MLTSARRSTYAKAIFPKNVGAIVSNFDSAFFMLPTGIVLAFLLFVVMA